MREMEILEDLEKSVINKVYYKEGIPEGTIEIIRNAFKEMLNRYKQLHCDVSAIAEYMNGNLREVENFVTKNIGESHKEKQVKQLQAVFRKMEVELQNSETQLDKKREEEQKEEILGIEWGNEETKNNIIEKLEDSLKDVQNAQKRILDGYGYSMDRIISIDENVQEHMKNFIKQNQDRIFQLFQRDSSSLKERILSEYSDYLLKINSERKVFKDGLNANISLEAQHEFAKEMVAKADEAKQDKKSDNMKSLPSDVII